MRYLPNEIERERARFLSVIARIDRHTANDTDTFRNPAYVADTNERDALYTWLARHDTEWIESNG